MTVRIRQISSLVLGAYLILIGFYCGLIPIIEITVHVFNGNQVHENFGVFAFSVPLIFLGFWVVKNAFNSRDRK